MAVSLHHEVKQRFQLLQYLAILQLLQLYEIISTLAVDYYLKLVLPQYETNRVKHHFLAACFVTTQLQLHGIPLF